MSSKNKVKKTTPDDASYHLKRYLSALYRPYILGSLTFLVFTILFVMLIYQRYQIFKQTQKKEAFDIANAAKDKLQQSLAFSLSAAKTLSFFIDNNGKVQNFDSIASEILEAGNDIDAVQLVPGGVIRYVYPLKGNEAVIGYDILNDPARNKEAYKAIEKKELFFAGPFELKQGGMAVVGRLPVFRKNKFWGFSAVIIKMSTLLRSAGIDSSGNKGYYFQISKINPDTKQEEFFITHDKKNAEDQSVSVNVPDGEWTLSVARAEVPKGFGNIILLAVSGFLLSVFCAVFVYRIATRPKRLNDMVEERTRELRNSENKYRSLIERVSDAFVSLDKDWNYTYVNKKAGELFAREPQTLIGKNIWKEFPEGIDKAFYHAYSRAMKLQTYQYIEEYYQPFDKWFENHIYPSKDGLTIFFKDVTEIKKVSFALKENEEKYRSLIEQASDGIVITDLDGIILEANNSISQMTGFDIQELIGAHLYDFLPDGDGVLNPLRINELMEGKSLLYERKLLKKDGTVLPAEINSKMASTHTLIGFIRDISERKKAEDKLVEKEKKLQQVLSSTADNFYVIAPDYKVVLINKVAERNLEIAWGKAVTVGTNLLNVIPVKGEEPIRENFEKAFAGEEVEYELYNSHPDLPAWVLIRFTPVRDESATITGVSVVAKDISERRKTEELRIESEERYRALVENATEALVVFDVKKQIFVSVSESATRLFGMPKEDLLKIGPVDVSPEYQPDGRLSTAAAREYIEKAINGEKTYFEWTHRNKKTGGLIPCELWLVRLPSENSVLIRGSIVDITERKKTEEEILNSKKLFQNLVENISGVYWANNLETYETLYISPSYEDIWGLKCEDLYKNPADFINSVHPEDRILLEEAHKNIAHTCKAKLSYRIVRPDGEIRWILANINVVVDSNGDKIEYGYAKDITKRKKADEEILLSEQKYRLLFYNNPLPMWMATIPELDIIDVNEAAIKHYGYTREEFLKLNARDMRPAEDVEHFVSEVNKMKPDMNNTRSWRHQKKDGSLIQVEIYSHEILYEGRRVWLGLSNDVTEKYNARELLQRSYEDIRQLASNLQSIREDERTKMAREIHDELGQQLTGLKMDLHWLSRKINNADEEVNNKMQESIELINTTIATVRKIATDLRPSILDDLGLLAALEWQGDEFEKRSGTKVLFINNAGELKVLPDVSTELFRIYQELLTNVARHANASLVTSSLQVDEKRLYFSIADNGIGFNKDSIGNKRTLGLLGIKERTLLIGGTYEINSRPGKGSETIISIPLNLIEQTV